jgi:hypothetical protein
VRQGHGTGGEERLSSRRGRRLRGTKRGEKGREKRCHRERRCRRERRCHRAGEKSAAPDLAVFRMHRPRRVSLQPELLRDGDKLGEKLEPVTEVTTYLVTHYVPKSAMEHEDRVRTRQLMWRVPIPNRYTAKAKLCFCKNNKRRIIIWTRVAHHTTLNAKLDARAACSVQSMMTAARTVRSLGQKRGTKTGD